jgi:branched-chain amino acid transport system permease protein
VIGGLTSGAIYCLIALGWVAIFNVSGILNLAQGEFVMLGALSFSAFHLTVGFPVGLAALGSILVVIAVALVMDHLALRRVGPKDVGAMILITLGVSVILREVARIVFGVDPLRHPPILPGDPIEVLGGYIVPQILIIWLVTAVLLLFLYFVLYRSLLGKSMRACAESESGARSVGISPPRMRVLALSIAAAMSAIAGMLIIPLTSMAFDGGTVPGLKGFVAAALGGMTSYPGAALGAFALGLFESLTAGYISSAYKDALSFSLLLLYLVLRPSARALLITRFTSRIRPEIGTDASVRASRRMFTARGRFSKETNK